MATNEKTSPLVNQQLPQFVIDEGPQLIEFIKAYYEYAEQANNASVQAAVAQTMAERQAYEEEQRKLTVSNSGGVAGSILRGAGKLAKGNYNMVQSQKNMTYTYKCSSCQKLQNYSSPRSNIQCSCGRRMYPQ